jgi:hypothetical protein
MRLNVTLDVQLHQNGLRIPSYPVDVKLLWSTRYVRREFQFHWHLPLLESATRCKNATWSWRRGSESDFEEAEFGLKIPMLTG